MAGNNCKCGKNKSFVAGVGATNVDILYSGLERLPREGEELYTKKFSLQLGGGVPATLINLGRLNIPVKIATQLGKDMFSRFARAQFENNGVEPKNLYCGDEIPLNITSVMITPGERTFVTYGQGEFEADEKMLELSYEMCHGAKIAIMTPGSFLPLYEKLKNDGTVLVFDCGWDDELCLEKYEKYLRLADYYTPNRKEALKITGCEEPYEAARVLSRYFERVVIKLDKDGCLGFENGDFFTVKPLEKIEAVDSTGAGDAFLAGFIYGLYRDRSFEECIRLGNITGGRCVEKVGCLSGYADENELIEALNN